MKQLEGKTALVTGGSRGFGREIVTALASEDATVWALARNFSLERLKREVPGVQTLVADVADPRTAPQALRDIQPDIIVLNAGATPRWVRSISNRGSNSLAIGTPTYT